MASTEKSFTVTDENVTFGAEQPFRYRGYVYDEETGFYYLQSRYYNPEVGRFISADVYLSTGQGVIGHNAYAYCGNNPVTRVDDEGEFWNIVIGAIVGAIVGAVVSAVTQAASGQDINWAAVGVAAACGALSGAVNAACPCMGVAATGLVQGSIGALEYAGTELAYGRTPTLEKTLMAGVTTGMFAAGGKFVAQSVGLTACFIAGTQVITTNGMVSIENISEGDYVYATDPETGESGFKRVVQTFERETDELVEITCDGETITTTPTHPFYVPQKGWTEAIKLRAGDILVTSNGEYVVVEKVQHEILEAPITVYNFEVEDYHTYYVSADANSDVFVLVHNKCIVNDEGVRVEVRTSNEHGLPHAHVTGRGPSTTIGLDKKPMPKHPALSAKQIRIINRHWEEIVDAIELFFPRKQ